MEAVCARRELQCRLYVKNEAAAVESSPELVEGLLAATEEAKGLVDRLLAQARLNAPPPPVDASSPAAATCQAPADGSMQGELKGCCWAHSLLPVAGCALGPMDGQPRFGVCPAQSGFRCTASQPCLHSTVPCPALPACCPQGVPMRQAMPQLKQLPLKQLTKRPMAAPREAPQQAAVPAAALLCWTQLALPPTAATHLSWSAALGTMPWCLPK
jgi:hypothetical protein